MNEETKLSNMNTYEKIREIINKEMPERLKLERGCIVKDFLKGTLEILAVYEIEGETPVYDYVFRGENEVSVMRSPQGNWDIFGKPVTLQEVLLMLNEKNVLDVKFGKKNEKVVVITSSGSGTPPYIKDVCTIDLTKSVEDQTEETKQAIYKLIK